MNLEENKARNHLNEETKLGTSITIQSDNSLECRMSFGLSTDTTKRNKF